MVTVDEAIAALEDAEADVRQLARKLRDARDEAQKLAVEKARQALSTT